MPAAIVVITEMTSETRTIRCTQPRTCELRTAAMIDAIRPAGGTMNARMRAIRSPSVVRSRLGGSSHSPTPPPKNWVPAFGSLSDGGALGSVRL